MFERNMGSRVVPKTVVVLGASADRAKFSNKAVRAYTSKGWKVYPVNPKGGEVEGLQVLPSLDSVPVHPERVTVYLPPSAGILALPDIARLEPQELYINPGAESDELIAEARRLGLDPILACSIVEIGERPANYS